MEIAMITSYIIECNKLIFYAYAKTYEGLSCSKLYKKKRIIFMDIKIENDLSRKKMKIRCFILLTMYLVPSHIHTPSILFLYPLA